MKEKTKEKKIQITPRDLLNYRVSKKDFQKDHLRRINNIKKFHIELIKTIKRVWLEAMKQICNKKMNVAERKQLRKYKNEWKDLKEQLTYLDLKIKKETTILLDGIFLLSNHSDDGEYYELKMAKNMGFTTKEGNFRDPEPYELDVFVQQSIFELVNVYDNLIILSVEIDNFIQTMIDYYDIKNWKVNGIRTVITKIDELSAAQARHDDRSIRAHDRLNETIIARNKERIQKKLTQKECAGILYRAEESFVDSVEQYKKKHYLTINTPKVPKEKSLLRRIQRWDHFNITKKGAPPPDGYSRNKSYKEFVEWANLYKDDKCYRWIATHPIIRQVPQ